MNVGVFLHSSRKVPIGCFFHISKLDYVTFVPLAGIEGLGIKRDNLIHCLCVGKGGNEGEGGRKRGRGERERERNRESVGEFHGHAISNLLSYMGLHTTRSSG